MRDFLPMRQSNYAPDQDRRHDQIEQIEDSIVNL